MNNNKKILILAFDGLEYNLVKKWGLTNLMQEYYGKYEAPISPRYRKPHTPSAWASFITGKDVESHHVDDWWTWGRLLDWLRYKPPFKWIKGKKMLLKKLGIKPRPATINKQNTIFDVIKPSVALFIPTFSEPFEIRYELSNAFNRGLDAYIKKIWEVHKFREHEFLKCLDKDWKLCMCWFDLADLLGHIFIVKNPLKLLKGYLELNKIAKIARSRLNKTIILIVSDHGMEPQPDGTGDHTGYGFWSLNVKPPFKPGKITDFYGMILKMIEHKH